MKAREAKAATRHGGTDGNPVPKARHDALANGGPLPPKRAEPASPMVSELEFIACDPVPANYRQYRAMRADKRRFELWDRNARTAWEVRDGPSALHNRPIFALQEMMVLISTVRGIQIPCYGDRGLALLDDQGKRLRVLHPDQLTYFDPPMAYDGHGDIPVQQVGFPDIVMEVDNTTDTRKGKLALYEHMGVPELWIEVPDIWLESHDAKPPRRPAGVVPGLTIYLLEGGRYRVHRASRALLGWKADDIHAALNDLRGLSQHHSEVLVDLGRRFGARTGTGPDDHPVMRIMRQESREEGQSRGLSEGRAQGLAEGQAQMARQILERRGIAVSPTFPADIPNLADVPTDALLDAAMDCASEQDFRARLQRRS